MLKTDSMHEQLISFSILFQLELITSVISREKYGSFVFKTGSAKVAYSGRHYIIDAYTIFSYTPFTLIQIIEKSDDWDGFVLESEIDALFSILSEISIRKRLFIRDNPCVKASIVQYSKVSELIASIDKRVSDSAEYVDSAFLFTKLIESLSGALCYEILNIYFKNSPLAEVPQNREDRIFNAFIISLFRNCHTQRTVAFYAAQQHLSPGHFSVLIKKLSGKTAIKWIEIITVLQIKQYLGREKMSIKEIAVLMNFPDQSILGRYFKNRTGVPPSFSRRLGKS